MEISIGPDVLAEGRRTAIHPISLLYYDCSEQIFKAVEMYGNFLKKCTSTFNQEWRLVF